MKVINEFEECIRLRKSLGLTLKACLSIPCRECQAYIECKVRNVIRIEE